MAVNSIPAPVRPANPNSAVVSAEADQRIATDAMTMAQQHRDQVQRQMMESATDANWYAWQHRVAEANRTVDRAIARVIETSKAVCRANAAAWMEA